MSELRTGMPSPSRDRPDEESANFLGFASDSERVV